MAGDDLWTMAINGMLPWEAVNAFLEGHNPEGPRIEYRRRFDPLGKGSTARFVDTIAAMANSGGGLILFGVEANAQNIPTKWPTISFDGLRPSTLYSSMRNYLDTPLAVEIGVARGTRDSTEGDVVVVRVPDSPVKPVFVNDAGVLVRVGDANVPARPSQLAEWFTTQSSAVRAIEGELYEAAPHLSVPEPQVNVAIGPSEAWPERAWGDSADAAVEVAVRSVYSDVGDRRVGAGLVSFRREDERGGFERWVWFKPTGSMLRIARLKYDVAERTSALRVAAEVQRAWWLALRAIPILLPGYTGHLSIVVSVGGIRPAGFRSDPPLTTRLQTLASDSSRPPTWQGARFRVAQDVEGFDLIRSLMEEMLRTFGYSPSGAAARELASYAVFDDGMRVE